MDHAFTNIKACESYFSHFDRFEIIFNFLASKETDINCSHELELKTKLTAL